MSKVETPAEKTARLRALRYAVKGSPDEHRAAKKAAKEALQAASARATENLFARMRADLNARPDTFIDRLEGYGLEAERLTRLDKRIKNL